MADRVLIIYGTLTDLNTYSNAERSHRQKAAAIKRDESERVWAECMDQKFGSIDDYPVDVDFHWYCPNKKIDKDNICFAKKFILDGMQHAGVLKNDGWAQIGDFSDKFHIDKDNPRVEVHFTVVK